MNNAYSVLNFHSMPIGIGYARPEQQFPDGLDADSPALAAMTDLRIVSALTVERTNTLTATRERMRKLGVRMLLVTDATAAVMGVITVTDLDSGRAEKIAAKTGEQPQELLVQDIMTLRGRIEVLPYAEVAAANVGQVLNSLRQTKRRHALVTSDDGNSIVGIFSLTRLCGQIGLAIRPGDPTEQIERALAPLLD